MRTSSGVAFKFVNLGQTLLPLPNGINSKCLPLTSTSFWVVRNLSGSNANGPNHTRFSKRWGLV
jgi:hypothetical protein